MSDNQTSTSKGKKLWYVDGISPSIAKRICKFAFGDNFKELRANEKERRYDVLLKISSEKEKEELKETVKYFKTHFFGFDFKISKDEDMDF